MESLQVCLVLMSTVMNKTKSTINCILDGGRNKKTDSFLQEHAAEVATSLLFFAEADLAFFRCLICILFPPVSVTVRGNRVVIKIWKKVRLMVFRFRGKSGFCRSATSLNMRLPLLIIYWFRWGPPRAKKGEKTPVKHKTRLIVLSTSGCRYVNAPNLHII